MTFNSPLFALFLLLSFCLYYALPGRFRAGALLVFSAVFYGWNGIETLIVPLVLLATAFGGGIAIGRTAGKIRNLVFYTSTIALVTILIAGKTAPLWSKWHFFKDAADLDPALRMLIPLGISYMVFQLVGYLVDCYRETIKPEKSILSFANYVFFFPKVISGPIERANDFLPQLAQEKRFDYRDVTAGLKLFAIGLFKKMVIADRLSLQTAQFIGPDSPNSGIVLVLVIFFIALQIYADLSGYTDMAIGIARLFGYRLSPNFQQPFFAQSTTEFWRRWHISLSTWFNYYVFTPLSVLLRGFGIAGTGLAVMLTFMLIGFWHGVTIGYLAFGLVQGTMITLELVTMKQRKKFFKAHPVIAPVAGTLLTALTFCISCMLFWFPKPGDIFGFFARITLPQSIHFSRLETTLAVAMAAALLLYDYFQTRCDPVEFINRQPAAIRWAAYIVLAGSILYLGYWSQTTFIYKKY